MSKGIYVSPNGIAKKGKKIYVGKTYAKKVKKAYIGIGNIARQFFSSEQTLSYYGTASNLSVGRHYLVATTVGDYALFGGGHSGSYSNVVDSYTSNLVKGTASNLSVGRRDLAVTTVGD